MIQKRPFKFICLAFVCDFTLSASIVAYCQGDDLLDSFLERPWTSARHLSVPVDDIWWTETGDQMAWMHKNVHQLFPTVNVYRRGPVSTLKKAQRSIQFRVGTEEGALDLDAFISSEASATLGMIILHQGEVVFESYPRMQSYEKPIYWSVTKVMPALLVRLFEERGLINTAKAIDFYIPELLSSAFSGIKVRNILDMSSGLDCEDDYTDRTSCYYQYSMAIGDGYRDDNSPDNPYDFLRTLKAERVSAEGTSFSYSGVNTFILGWLVESIAQKPFHEVFTEEIWSKIGAESDASFLAYRYGIPLTHGGFLSNMRDMARFGLLFTPSYRVVSNKEIVSEETLDLILNQPNPNLINIDGSHNSYQWDRIYDDGFMFKGGWGGQGILVNPLLDVVAVYTGYYKDDLSQAGVLEPLLDALRRSFAAR